MTGHASNCDWFAPVSVLETEWPCSCGADDETCPRCDGTGVERRGPELRPCPDCMEDDE